MAAHTPGRWVHSRVMQRRVAMVLNRAQLCGVALASGALAPQPCSAGLTAVAMASCTVPRRLLPLLLCGLCVGVASMDSIISGATWYDTDGNVLHAHGGGILKVGDTYYWHGTSAKLNNGGAWVSEAINAYSSADLLNWKFEGVVLRNTSIGTQLPAPLRVERPKVVFNAHTKQYVMWFHLDTVHFSAQQVGVATCDSPTGAFTFVAGFQPDGLPSYDMGLYQQSDGAAFLVRSVKNQFVGISQLTEDYMNTTGIISKGPRIEGQAIFRDAANKLYLWGSHLTGWSPNAAVLSSTPSAVLRGAQWSAVGNPSGSATTFNSQSTFILPYNRYYIYMGDRWNKDGPGSVGNASYVWLPLRHADNGSWSMPFQARWTP